VRRFIGGALAIEMGAMRRHRKNHHPHPLGENALAWRRKSRIRSCTGALGAEVDQAFKRSVKLELDRSGFF
jgi:hypothetical protein